MTQLEAWEEVHKNRDWLADPSTEFLAFMAENYWGCNKDAVFLDLGCGVGASSVFLADKKFKVTAVDFSQAACQKLCDNLKPEQSPFVTVINADVLSIEFEPQSFDCILAINVFDCLDLEQATALCKKTKTWLKPGGRFFCRALAEMPKELTPGNVEITYYATGDMIRSVFSAYSGIVVFDTRYVTSQFLAVTNMNFQVKIDG